MKLVKRQDGRAGFNLIEAAIVLGIVGLVVAGIWAAAASAYEGMRQQDTSKNLLAFAQNVKNFYAGSGATAIKNKDAQLIAAGVVPKPWVIGATLQHAWGSSGAVSNIVVTNGDPGTFVVTFNKPANGATDAEWKKICNTMVARNVNSSNGAIVKYGTEGAADTAVNGPVTAPGCPNTGAAPSFAFTING